MLEESRQTARGDAVPVDDDCISAAVLLFDDNVISHVEPRLVDSDMTSVVTQCDDALGLWPLVQLWPIDTRYVQGSRLQTLSCNIILYTCLSCNIAYILVCHAV